ncbi:hypothetical protein NFI96_004807 [Prochilodus magdalenae]|nr:hypothetical protein NFI96_004807 [Prochilodus magdalenae]
MVGRETPMIFSAVLTTRCSDRTVSDSIRCGAVPKPGSDAAAQDALDGSSVECEDSMRLCWGHVLTDYNIRNADSCFKLLDRIFNNEKRVIEAARVDTVYEDKLQAAAEKFITMASGLPRGFQALGAVYNCMSCQYDTCEFPLDCPCDFVVTAVGKRKLNKGTVPCLFAWNDYSMPAPRLNVWQHRPRCPSPVLAASDTDQEMEVQIAPDHDYSVTPTTSAMADALANKNEALKRKRQELQWGK